MFIFVAIMKRFRLIILAFLVCSAVSAQMKPAPSEVLIQVGDTAFALTRQQTQTERRQGWDVVGYNVGKKDVKYLWGKMSKQLCADAQPTLVIDPQNCTLGDYALIRLKAKKQYRQLPCSQLKDNEYMLVTKYSFKIEVDKQDRFLITPLKPLRPGEYFIVNLSQSPVGDLQDYVGYCITIPQL